MTERKLARVVKIDEIKQHGNADTLDLAVVGGWQVVIKQGIHKAGDLAVFFEVDAMLPVDDPAFSFMEDASKNYTREGKRYARIRSMKIRKELSQGMLMPLSEFKIKKAAEGADMTEFLGVIKYESAETSSSANGGNANVQKIRSFPSFIPKTDQERVQNMPASFAKAVADGDEFEVTYKLDGSSFTAYVNKGAVGVCSRNIELRLEPEKWDFIRQCKEWFKEFLNFNKRFFKHFRIRFPEWKTGIVPEANAFTSMFNELGLKEKLLSIGGNIALQGELVGPSIQSNFEGVKKNELYIYQVYDIGVKSLVTPEVARELVRELGLNYVPIFMERMKLPATMQELIALADGPSGLNGKYREGLVFKSLKGGRTFKVISNNYSLKEA